MELNELTDLVYNSLDDMKAVDIKSIDVRGKSTLTDILFFATGNSTRHVKSIADNVIVKAKEANVDIIGSEGRDSAEWILVDLNYVIVHIMLEATREFYQLEKLWEADDANDKSVEELMAEKTKV